MQVYAGFDLHANNNFLGVVDESGKKIFKKKLLNEPETILNALDPLNTLTMSTMLSGWRRCSVWESCQPDIFIRRRKELFEICSARGATWLNFALR